MNAEQIAGLVQPFIPAGALVPEQLEALARYLELLQRWNARTNLTAIRDEKSIVLRHFGESLFAASKLLDPVRGRERPVLREGAVSEGVGELGTFSVIDVGSGAGFPGLPIKIYAPQIGLTLIESQNKKVTFLREAVRALHLHDASVYSGRAENYDRKADLVTLRAVEQFERVLRVAAGLVKRAGGDVAGEQESAVVKFGASSARLALLIGAGQHRTAISTLPEFRWEEPIQVPLSSERILLVGRPPQG